MNNDDLRSPDRAVALEAVRDVLAAALVEAKPGETAALAKQMRDTIQELDQVRTPEAVSVVDDLAARRAGRGSAATGS